MLQTHLDWPRLPAVRPEAEGVEAPLLPQLVEDGEVDEGVVEIVGVRRVLITGPAVRGRHLGVKHGVLWLRLVINGVKPHHVLQELVQGRVRGGVYRDLDYVNEHHLKSVNIYLKQRLEQIL